MEKIVMRQQVLLNHLDPRAGPRLSDNIVSSDCAAGDSAPYAGTADFLDDVVIVAAFRTPICRAKRGGFKDTFPEDLLAPVLKAVVDSTGINPGEVGDIVVGTVLAPGSLRAIECRAASFYAGFPDTVPVRTVNRQCSSGLQAVTDVFAAIKAGLYDVGIGAGVETMSVNRMDLDRRINPRVRSHQKAAAARASGRFNEEIVPVHTKLVDPKTGEEKDVTIVEDDGIRPETSLTTLAKLRTAFKESGTTTAGNSSQVSDGAAAVLLMKRKLALEKNLPILGVFRSFVALGVDPAVMGIGPAVAIPAAVKAAGLEIDDIDLFEINEAFASQFSYCVQELGLDEEKVNVNGGAIALGHPLGATGARCVATLLHEMKKRGKNCRFGVVTMCIGSGMGAAAVFEHGDAVDRLRNTRPIDNPNLLSKDAK